MMSLNTQIDGVIVQKAAVTVKNNDTVSMMRFTGTVGISRSSPLVDIGLTVDGKHMHTHGTLLVHSHFLPSNDAQNQKCPHEEDFFRH